MWVLWGLNLGPQAYVLTAKPPHWPLLHFSLTPRSTGLKFTVTPSTFCVFHALTPHNGPHATCLSIFSRASERRKWNPVSVVLASFQAWSPVCSLGVSLTRGGPTQPPECWSYRFELPHLVRAESKADGGCPTQVQGLHLQEHGEGRSPRTGSRRQPSPVLVQAGEPALRTISSVQLSEWSFGSK